MNKKIIFRIINKYGYFFWLVILIFLTVFITYFYNLNKKSQINYLNKALKNTYLNNSIKKLTSELKPRYINIEYNVKKIYSRIYHEIKTIKKPTIQPVAPFLGIENQRWC